MRIELAPETLFLLGPLPVTNTLLTTVLVSIAIITALWWLTRILTLVPGKRQNVLEGLVEPLYAMVEDIAGSRARLLFPIVTTFLLFILVANLAGLLPGFGTVGFFLKEHGVTQFHPMLRAPTSDLNVTLALALISLVLTHALSVKVIGVGGWLGRFFSLNPIFLFVGFIEIIAEFTKLFSLSFRLFGNIFAGEMVLSRIAVLSPFLFPLPFLGLEIIVGFVQAAVFMMLTLVFMALMTQKTIAH